LFDLVEISCEYKWFRAFFPVIIFDILLETSPRETAMKNWEAGWVE